MPTAVVGQTNIWKSSYGNKTIPWVVLYEVESSNRALDLFHCISVVCKQVVELKSLIHVHLVT